jgi:hypothetical protein
MRTALSRSCLPLLVSAAFPLLSHASLAYSAKRAGAEIFRGEALDPPPLAALTQGETVKMIAKGADASLIETEGGIKGWVRNRDLTASLDPKGLAFNLKPFEIRGAGDFNHSENVLLEPAQTLDLLPLDRSFLGEVPGNLDREQMEMRHDEN